MYFIVAKNIDLMLNSLNKQCRDLVNRSLIKVRGDNGRIF